MTGECDKCRSCGAPIIWGVTIRGKRIPIDAEPDPKGNMGLIDGRFAVVPSGFEGTRFSSHFASCPDAKSFRRAKR